ncbi:MAG: clostripain-related cysteine peptidase [Thermodesulfobacteriota bacterium]
MKSKWTVMIYMAGGNDLDPASLDDIGELARVGSSEEVNVLVQLDRDNDLMTKRFRITKGGGYRKDCIETFGETNSGDPKVLLDFIDWSIGKYPAEHYFLILWNHGSGWWDEPDRAFRLIKRNIAYDDSSGGDSLDNQELKDVLKRVSQGIGKRIEIIGMDACLMTMVEVAYQIRESAMVMVGSEIEEPGEGWPYEEVIGILTKRPGGAPATMARKIVSAYTASYQGTGQSVTQSALNLEKIGDVVKPLDLFSMELIAALDGNERATLLKAVGSAWERSPREHWVRPRQRLETRELERKIGPEKALRTAFWAFKRGV